MSLRPEVVDGSLKLPSGPSLDQGLDQSLNDGGQYTTAFEKLDALINQRTNGLSGSSCAPSARNGSHKNEWLWITYIHAEALRALLTSHGLSKDFSVSERDSKSSVIIAIS